LLKSKKIYILVASLLTLFLSVSYALARFNYSFNPNSGKLRTSEIINPSADAVSQNKSQIIQKVKPSDINKVAVKVNDVPLSYKLALLDIELGVAGHIGTAKSVLEGNEFPGIDYERAQNIVLGKEDLRKNVVNEVLGRMITQELYWQEAQRKGYDVGEDKAREYAVSEFVKFKSLKDADPEQYAANMVYYEIILEILDMTEDEYLAWTVNARRKELSIRELANTMSTEEYTALGHKLLSDANIQYVNMPPGGGVTILDYRGRTD